MEEVERTLAALEERELVRLLPRRPGEREQRYVQLLGGASPTAEAAAGEAPGATGGGHVTSGLEERVARLEEQVAALQAALERLDG